MSAPGPHPEHEALAEIAGPWEVRSEWLTAPGAEPLRSEGTERVELFGPFWRLGWFESEVAGTAVRGLVTLGFDPRAERFVGSWVDTLSPHLMRLEGQRDAAGRILELEGEGPHPTEDGALALWRSREERTKDGGRLVEHFAVLDGVEWRLARHVYRRPSSL